jgi:hypothetical protein
MSRDPQSRRNFLRMLIGGVAAGAAVRTWPFRVFSFPSEIVTPDLSLGLGDFEIQPMYDFYEMLNSFEPRRQTLFNIPAGHESRITNHESRP